jgi:hypothetical protein
VRSEERASYVRRATPPVPEQSPADRHSLGTEMLSAADMVNVTKCPSSALSDNHGWGGTIPGEFCAKMVRTTGFPM